MGLIKFFGKQALKRFKNSVDELNQALNEIDMENVEARFNELKEDFNKEFDKLKEKFYTVGKKFVVEIPYDRDTQKLSFKMENGIIPVVVETDETTANGTFVSKSTTTRNIPESVNVNEFKQKYLEDEKTPVISDAAKMMAELSEKYSPEKPLYIVAIGAITNVASALLLNPKMKDNVVVVWLGGHAHHYCDTIEFNMKQDIAAARVVMQSGVPFVQLPCEGVVGNFKISEPELNFWFIGKNELATYLGENTISEANSYAKGLAWTRTIWDVTAVAWLLNDDEQFMLSRIIPTKNPAYDGLYEADGCGLS